MYELLFRAIYSQTYYFFSIPYFYNGILVDQLLLNMQPMFG